jgi:hypothetical protein
MPDLSVAVGIPVEYPTSSVVSTPLTPEEQFTVSSTLDSMGQRLAAQSPTIGLLFASQKAFFLAAAQIAKAKFQQATVYPPSHSAPQSAASKLLTARQPDAGQIGMQFILPEDIKRNQAGGTPTAPTTWDLTTVAGTQLFLIGSSAAGTAGFFSTTGTEPNRYILAIMRNGIVEVGGNTPSIDQLFYTTNQQAYVPWAVSPLVAQTVEPTKAVYIYDTPAAYIIDETILSKLIAMPKYSQSTRIALIGVKYYEYNQYTSLQF